MTIKAECGTALGTGSAADFLPEQRSLATMREAAAECRGCDLWTCGKTVFGEGPAHAEVMMVGEQPGDQEERTGHPFVGPAGQLLDEALELAGIDRSTVYITNAVKHFKYERGDKSSRRIHKKPNDMEIKACNPWLRAEIKVTKPRVIILLGATAAQALLGKQFRVTKERGKPQESDLAEIVIATVHPSSVLRAPESDKKAARDDFFADIQVIAGLIAK